MIKLITFLSLFGFLILTGCTLKSTKTIPLSENKSSASLSKEGVEEFITQYLKSVKTFQENKSSDKSLEPDVGFVCAGQNIGTFKSIENFNVLKTEWDGKKGTAYVKMTYANFYTKKQVTNTIKYHLKKGSTFLGQSKLYGLCIDHTY